MTPSEIAQHLPTLAAQYAPADPLFRVSLEPAPAGHEASLLQVPIPVPLNDQGPDDVARVAATRFVNDLARVAYLGDYGYTTEAQTTGDAYLGLLCQVSGLLASAHCVPFKPGTDPVLSQEDVEGCQARFREADSLVWVLGLDSLRSFRRVSEEGETPWHSGLKVATVEGSGSCNLGEGEVSTRTVILAPRGSLVAHLGAVEVSIPVPASNAAPNDPTGTPVLVVPVTLVLPERVEVVVGIPTD